MPFTTQELADAGKTSIDYHLRNNPIDQIAVERPFLKKLMAGQESFPGAKQFITEQIRYTYGGNFQWYYGAQSVSYNARNTIEQTNWPWRSAHDGFFLDEDRLTQNGVILTDDTKGGRVTKAELVQLTPLLDEHSEALRLGFEEGLSRATLRDGSESTDDLEGLDHIIHIDPTAVGTPGSIDQQTNTWWQNNAPSAGLATAALIGGIETQWRACIRNGGMPNFVMAGSTFIDDMRAAVRATNVGMYELNPNNQAQIYDAVQHREGLDSGLRIHGVPVIWNPEFSEIDALDSPTVPWEERCYLLNMRTIKLRPAKGHNMISRTPPRVYNKYVHYWALTWKGGLTCNKRVANSVVFLD